MRQAAGLSVAHVVPAMAFWAMMGGLLARFAPMRLMLIAAMLYAIVHGLAESVGLRLRAPSVDWQVPSGWLRGRSPAGKIAIWGALLGPGLFTRNPYAGMWMVLLLVAGSGSASAGATAGALVGLAHGVGRSTGVLRNLWRGHPGTAVWEAILGQMRWRLIDGVALLLAAAMLASALAWRW